MRTLLVIIGIIGIVGMAVPLRAQGQAPAGGRGRGGVLGPVDALGQEVKRPAAPTGPAPRLPDGTVDLTGVWVGGGSINDIAQGLPKGDTLPLLPASVKLMEFFGSENNQYGVAGGHENPFAK